MKSPSWGIMIAAAILLLGGTIASVMYRMGAHHDVVIERTQEGPFHLLARDHLGPYHRIASVISEVETWAKANNEPCELSFGLYLDNPETTDEDRLKSRGGCLIDESKTPRTYSDKTLTVPPAGVTRDVIPAFESVTATFTGAPSLGPVKVYPRVFEFLEKNNLEVIGPILEIYKVESANSGFTRYLFPVRAK